MNSKHLTVAALVMIVVAGGAFYGGTVYAKSSVPTRGQFATNGQFTRQGGGRGAGGLTMGQIIAQDSSSITVKMQDGSTKIVLLGTSTPVLKTTSGSLNDLSNGINVAVVGTTNSDGSITAQSIQIRPAGMAGFFGRGGQSGQQSNQ